MIVNYIKLLRPPLLVLGFLASLALMVHYGNWVGLKGWLILLAVGFGNLAFNTLNEAFDVDTDRILKPDKPLPSGAVSVSTAIRIGIVSFMISLISVIVLSTFSPIYGLIAIAGYFGGFVYNVLRRKDLIGNVALGLTYFSAAYMSSYPHGLEFAIAFAYFTIGFNIAVQIQDIEGDLKAGVRTAPIELGVSRAKGFSMFFLLCSLVALLLSNFSVVSMGIFALSVTLALIALWSECYELFARWMTRFLLILFFISVIL